MTPAFCQVGCCIDLDEVVVLAGKAAGRPISAQRTGRQANRQVHKQANRQLNRQLNKQVIRQANMQANRQFAMEQVGLLGVTFRLHKWVYVVHAQI